MGGFEDFGLDVKEVTKYHEIVVPCCNFSVSIIIIFNLALTKLGIAV